MIVPRPTGRVVDVLSAALGAGLGVGALLFQEDVSALAWWLTPAVLSVLMVVHARVLFGGGGPFRA